MGTEEYDYSRNLRIYHATVPDIISKGGAAATAGKGSGIEAYPAAENSTVPDRAVLAACRDDQLAIQYLIL